MSCPACGCKEVHPVLDENDRNDDRLQCCAACGEVFDLDEHAYEEDDDVDRSPPQFGCCLPPGECCMPGLHFPSECHTAADYERRGQ